MPSFKDRKGNEWQVQLDAPTIEEIKDDHGISLVNLDSDPLLKLRNEPMVLVACVSVICRDEIKERGLTEMEFMKLLPRPPDELLSAIQDAVIGFFPSGRASHVRGVLATLDQMATKNDEILLEEINLAANDPQVTKAISQKAKKARAKVLNEMMTDQSAGT